MKSNQLCRRELLSESGKANARKYHIARRTNSENKAKEMKKTCIREWRTKLKSR
ncbi:hypothetical protein HYC85_029803 [Camellia sinensis]|uniref:Uncharacterized protein n=1 Tax=Camellia sinensis TaxID=4442 RepID=A0A7J7FYZ4_CAMSI|nr:hypothetical protein HYC85_029803 [Camellia sinensis]